MKLVARSTRLTEGSLVSRDGHPARATLKRRSPYSQRGVRPWNISVVLASGDSESLNSMIWDQVKLSSELWVCRPDHLPLAALSSPGLQYKLPCRTLRTSPTKYSFFLLVPLRMHALCCSRVLEMAQDVGTIFARRRVCSRSQGSALARVI